MSATILGEGMTLAIPGGASVQIPPDAVRAGTTVSIAAGQPSGGPTDAWPADAVGLTWTIEAGDGALAKPVILTFPFDTAALPQGTVSADLILAYRDLATDAWSPVPATVDATAQTVTATVDHLSDWGLFTIDWDYWVAFIKQVASGNLGDFLNGVVTITDACTTESPTKSPVFTLDNGATNGMVKGCITDSTKTSADIRMTNLRAFRLQVFGSALGEANGSLLASGESVAFSVGGNQAQPVVVAADLDALGLGYDITDIVLRLLPGSDLIKDAGTYSKVLDEIMTAQSKLWTSATILEDLKAGKLTSAASATVELLTSETYLTTLLDALHAVGTARGVPLLAALSKDGIRRVLTVVNLTDLIITTFTFITQYIITAHSGVRVGWETKPNAPTNVTITNVFDQTDETVTFAVRWRSSADTTVEGFHIYQSSVFVGEVVCAPEVPCGDPPCPKPVLVESVGPTTRHITLPGEDYSLQCVWVAAFNSAGESNRVKAIEQW